MTIAKPYYPPFVHVEPTKENSASEVPFAAIPPRQADPLPPFAVPFVELGVVDLSKYVEGPEGLEVRKQLAAELEEAYVRAFCVLSLRRQHLAAPTGSLRKASSSLKATATPKASSTTCKPSRRRSSTSRSRRRSGTRLARLSQMRTLLMTGRSWELSEEAASSSEGECQSSFASAGASLISTSQLLGDAEWRPRRH